jgi:hypothetical protein
MVLDGSGWFCRREAGNSCSPHPSCLNPRLGARWDPGTPLQERPQRQRLARAAVRRRRWPLLLLLLLLLLLWHTPKHGCWSTVAASLRRVCWRVRSGSRRSCRHSAQALPQLQPPPPRLQNRSSLLSPNLRLPCAAPLVPLRVATQPSTLTGTGKHAHAHD